MKIKLPVTWEMSGFVEVDASSIPGAISAFDPNKHPLPAKAEYVESSFRLVSNDAAIVGDQQS